MGDRAADLPEIIKRSSRFPSTFGGDKRSVQCELRQLQAYMPGKAFIAECQRQSGVLMTRC
ncbi:MAG: hypothetical protein ACLUMK_12080 [Christensenellales bacterium]